MGTGTPLLFVCVVSALAGFLLVVIFRYTSNQKAIGRAKDRLKAQLLAVRLFQDQLPVVLRAYWRILVGTGRYLRLSFAPLLLIVVPLTFLMIQLDRYLGAMPLQPGQPFLLSARGESAEVLDRMQLQLPAGVEASAPAVHIPRENEIVWRLVANKAGEFEIGITGAGETAFKSAVVCSAMERLSPVRLRGRFWERIWSSAEGSLPANTEVAAIRVAYPARSIGLAGFEENWIVWFFVLSLVSGFVFKSVLGIQI